MDAATQARLDMYTLRNDATEALGKRIKSGEIKIDKIRGHWLHKSEIKKLTERYSSAFALSEATAEDFKRFLDGDPDVRIHIRMECSICHEDCFYVTGDRIGATEACEYPGAHEKPFSVEIDVPSGKMAFFNDLREFFPINDDHYVNYLSEIIRCSQDYAADGLIHINVGNSSPSVHQVGNTLIVGRSVPEEKWDSKKKEYVPLSPEAIKAGSLPGEKVGYISTSLWWFGACDYSHLVERVKKLGDKDNLNCEKDIKQAIKNGDIFVVDVEPGRYRATTQYHILRMKEEDYDDKAEYCRIERVGKAKSKKSPEVQKLPVLTLEQTMHVMHMMYPDLYPTRRRCLDTLYCVCGSGHDWTEDGRIAIGGGKGYKEAVKHVLSGGKSSLRTLPHELRKGDKVCAKYLLAPMIKDKELVCPKIGDDMLKGEVVRIIRTVVGKNEDGSNRVERRAVIRITEAQKEENLFRIETQARSYQLKVGDEITEAERHWAVMHHDLPPHAESLYPFRGDEYSRLGSIPDNVQQDFLEGAMEILDIAAELKDVKDHHGSNKSNAVEALKIQKKLLARFGKRLKKHADA